jgi:DNA-binding transcriptional ArsR family regulator
VPSDPAAGPPKSRRPAPAPPDPAVDPSLSGRPASADPGAGPSRPGGSGRSDRGGDPPSTGAVARADLPPADARHAAAIGYSGGRTGAAGLIRPGVGAVSGASDLDEGGPAEPSDEVFAALADPTRRAILRAVADGGPVTATALAGELPVSRQAVAKHLRQLRDAGLVAGEREGRETRFTVVAAPLDDLASWAAAAGRRWDDRLARLRRHLG